MHANVIWDGTMLLHKFRTTNKVKEDEEELTVYCVCKGNVGAEVFSMLTGADPQERDWQTLFWGKDGAPRHPAMDSLVLLTESTNHIIEIDPAGYRDENATVRKWKLRPVYGHQFAAQFEVLLKPETNAVIGKMAHLEGHEITLRVQGGRSRDAFEEGADGATEES